jgi:hypothetical protein
MNIIEILLSRHYKSAIQLTAFDKLCLDNSPDNNKRLHKTLMSQTKIELRIC